MARCGLQGGNIGRITTAGVVTSYQLPTSNAGAAGITAGPDGAMWFTEDSNGSLAKIGHITTSGVFTEFALPNQRSHGDRRGPRRALWFIESAITNIGRITTSGTISEFPCRHRTQITACTESQPVLMAICGSP